MKKFFSNKIVAVVITAVIMFTSTGYSVHRTLGARCQEITDGFYLNNIVDYVSISAHLAEGCNLSTRLLSVVGEGDAINDRAEAVRLARESLLNLLNSDDADVADIYDANSELSKVFGELVAAMGSAADEDPAATYIKDFWGAQSAIEASGYNESVRAFRRETLNVFPTGLLSSLFGVEAPVLYE